MLSFEDYVSLRLLHRNGDIEMPSHDEDEVDFESLSETDISDFHTSSAGMVAVYLIGIISIEWNYLEHQLSVLIWQILGDFETGGAITSQTQNVSRA